MEQFDYIIAGAGCAGRCLAVHLIHSRKLADKKILLVDDGDNTDQYRTWCFWEKDPGLFDEIVSHCWSSVAFTGKDGLHTVNIAPYHHKMIRGDRFYAFTDRIIAGAPNVTLRKGLIGPLFNLNGKAVVIVEGEKLTADYIFCSRLPQMSGSPAATGCRQFISAWEIETDIPCLDPDSVTLADFGVASDNKGGFFRMLPYSRKRALVTYTLMATQPPAAAISESLLQDYIRTRLGCSRYTSSLVEEGVLSIDEQPRRKAHDRIIYLGMGPGNISAYSGYSFHHIQRHSLSVTRKLLAGVHPVQVSGRFDRFRLYERILLRLITDPAIDGQKALVRLFSRNEPATLLKFLDNETSCWEELRIFTTLHKRAFATESFRKLTGYILSTVKSFSI